MGRDLSAFAKAALVIILAANCVSLGACSKHENRADSEGSLREVSSEELEAASEEELREADQYEVALSAAPVYRSEIRDLLIRHPERFRSSGLIGLGEFWYGTNLPQAFRCIHPEEPISRAEQDGWQLVHCDRRSAYFLRGPLAKGAMEEENSIVPLLEDVFEVLRLSFGSPPFANQEAVSPERSPSIRAALPSVYDQPSEADLAQAEIGPYEADEVRVAHYDFQRRKEISVHNVASQTVVTLIFRQSDEVTPGGARAVRVVNSTVIWAQSPRTDFDEMMGLVSIAEDYVRPPIGQPGRDVR